MATTRVIDLPWTSIITDSGTEVFIPCTDWLDAPDVTAGRGYGESRAEAGSAQWGLAIQTANDVRSPDTHTRVTALQSSGGVFDPDATNTSLDFQGKRYVRAGWSLKAVTGVVAVRVRGRIELVSP
jgi:hypothetical protein